MEKQKMILVQANDYEELAIGIGHWIKTLENSMEIQQIDYFGMEEDQDCACSAFVLFKPKECS